MTAIIAILLGSFAIGTMLAVICLLAIKSPEKVRVVRSDRDSRHGSERN